MIDPEIPNPTSFPGIAALSKAVGKPFWIVDLEATTGDLKDPDFGIVEVGYLVVGTDGSSQETSFLVDAGFPMNPYASRITGIQSHHYKGEPGYAERWPSIEQHLRDSVISGFGIHDLDCKALFKEAETRLVGGCDRFRIDSLDARSLWRIHSGADKGQLSEVAEAFGHRMIHSHRALDDARGAAHALEGLVAAMGVKACLSAMRLDWNPLESMDQAAQAAESASLLLSAALKASAGAGSFELGLALMEKAGTRPHLSNKGLFWWLDGAQAKVDSAPSSPQMLAAHFSCALPGPLAEPNALVRCSAILEGSSEPMGDEQAARSAMCRSPGTASAARAKLIRAGSLAAWSGIDPILAAFAKTMPDGALDERELLEQMRANSTASGISPGHPALSACAASLAQERGLASRPEPARSSFRKP